ncbi:MAG: hypothetical protein KatS3mg062_0309 [Tepidiforma sp.]|nr:MAG: hypothetical protein KatS3mg062_0309 [Tepidiforma sp.]
MAISREQRQAAAHYRRPSSDPGVGRFGRLVLIVTGLAAVLALGPIAWGIVAGVGGVTGPSSAFASAPPGLYAVVTRTEGAVDVVGIARADQPDTVVELARVPHLDGFAVTGSVDPAGRFLAVAAVDAGTPLQPVASLLLIDILQGTTTRLVTGIDAAQEPLWTPAGSAVIVTRTRENEGAVDVFEVGIDGALRQRWSQRAFGVYPIGWKDGRLLTVAIDGRGSTLQAEGEDLVHLSTSITRDWALSPDGSAIAFVEVLTDTGVRYTPRVVSLEGGRAAAAQVAAMPGAEALGAAWDTAGRATFGSIPRSTGVSGDASAQGLTAAGFDVPLGYSPDGTALAVVHWDGTGFDNPGTPALELAVDGDRGTVPGYRGFLGWVRR